MTLNISGAPVQKILVERLANRIWQIFEAEGWPSDSDGNWNAAIGIVERIMNGAYKIEEFRSFFSSEDYDDLSRRARENLARLSEDRAGY